MKYYEKEMTTEHPVGCAVMTWEDAEAMEKLNAECGWGFNHIDCLRFIITHEEAYNKINVDSMEAYRTMECIEWRLEDANFHMLCGLLHKYNYKGALEWVMKTYYKEEE